MNKKIGVSVFCFVFMFMLVANLGVVSAYCSSGDIGCYVRGVFEAAKGILQALWSQLISPIITGVFNITNPDEIVPKFLFFMIVLGVVHFALRNVNFFQNQNSFLYGIIVFAVAFLSVRYLSQTNIVETILFPYSVLGIVITSGLPFLTMFMILNIGFTGPQYKWLRVGGWSLFGVAFIWLWFNRGGAVTVTNAGGQFVDYTSFLPFITGAAINPVAGNLANFSWIYLVTALLCFAVAIFDNRIQRVKDKIGEDKLSFIQKSSIISDLDDKLAEMQKRLSMGIGNREQIKEVIDDLLKRKSYIMRTK